MRFFELSRFFFPGAAFLFYLASVALWNFHEMKIKDLGEDERPVEKMLAKGPGALSNAELLAILLRSGSSGLNAMDTSRLLLAKADGKLSGLASLSSEGLRSVPGIGDMKASSVMAAFELGRRFWQEGSGLSKVSVTGPGVIFRTMRPVLMGLDHEECWILYLNRANYLTGREMLSRGGRSATVIDIKMTVSRAIEKKAEGVVLVHNHPSGNPVPGEADIRETRLLKKALESVDISLVDHVVVSDDSFFSFADNRISVP